MEISRKKIFGGRLLKLFTVKKKLPNGRDAYFEVIEHPGASIIIPFVSKKIVLIRQYRGVLDKYIWEFPAGKIDPGETPYACAKREIIEETGFVAKNIKKLGFIYTTPGFCDEKIHVYKAECKKEQSPCPEYDEMIKVKVFTKKEIREMFKLGKINDAKTIAALSFANIL